MIHKIVFPLLLPIFILQGRYVRKVTPKLAEARGDRTGRITNGSNTSLAINLAIIGDSAAAGVGVERQTQALSGSIIDNLNIEQSINWQLLAKSGLDTKSCHLMLASQPSNRFDVVVLSLGVNDVLSKITAQQWVKQQISLVKLLQHKFNAKQILLTKIPPMAQFSSLPQPLRWFLGARCNEFNRALAQEANNHYGCEIITLTEQLKDGHMASDGFHPGAIVYLKWGEAVAQLINQRWQLK